MVDSIADKDYTKLVSSIPPKKGWSSWIDAEPTVENDCIGFGRWLDEQLAMLEEDLDKKFVVDHFDNSCIMGEIDEDDEARLETYNWTQITYRPTSFGEYLDFVFEINFSVENGRLVAVFEVNA